MPKTKNGSDTCRRTTPGRVPRWHVEPSGVPQPWEARKSLLQSSWYPILDATPDGVPLLACPVSFTAQTPACTETWPGSCRGPPSTLSAPLHKAEFAREFGPDLPQGCQSRDARHTVDLKQDLARPHGGRVERDCTLALAHADALGLARDWDRRLEANKQLGVSCQVAAQRAAARAYGAWDGAGDAETGCRHERQDNMLGGSGGSAVY
eukprot:364487-Chlamydomonas_euryale.AAC.27